MKNIKKILTIIVLFVVSLSLASCGNTKVNQNVPYGDLTNATYASSNGNTVTEKELYDLMRYDGYSTMKDELKKLLFSDIYSYFNYDKTEDPDNFYEINQKVVADIYGVSTVDGFKELKEVDKTNSIQKYVDNKRNQSVKDENGNYFTVESIKAITIDFAVDEDGNDVFDANFPEVLYESYIFDMAMSEYALEQLKATYNLKTITKWDGTKVTNDNYVSEDDVQAYYYNNAKNYIDYKGIVISFASEAQAERIIKANNAGSLEISSDPDTALATYMNIYNARYATRDDLNNSNYLTDSHTDLSVSNSSNKLDAISSQFQTLFLNMENGDYLTEIRNVDGQFYLVYRLEGSDPIEWADLADDEKNPEIDDNVFNKTLEYILEGQNTVIYQNEIIDDRYNELIDSGELYVYDPVYSVLFRNDYSDYELSTASSDTKVFEFTYDGETKSMTVRELYNILEAKNGKSTAIEKLKDKYLVSLDTLTAKIDSDDISDYTDQLDDEIKAFNKGKASYSSSIGVSCYLQLTYQYSTRAEVLESMLADNVETLFNNYYGNYVNESTFDASNSTLFANFASIYKELYDNYFAASISHILIGIDEDGSGNYEDPDTYRSQLYGGADGAQAQALDAAILNLANAIISEVKALTISKTVIEALEYIVTAYNNNLEVASLSTSTNTVTWEAFKTQFPLALRAEDLSEISSSNASSYVNEFSIAARDLYNEVIDGNIDEEVMEDKGVFALSTEQTSLDNLCKTSYGYHLLNIYGITEQTSAEFLIEDDDDSSDSDYKMYEHIRVIIEADNDDDDDDLPEIVVYANGYSENAWASEDQLFVYFFESVLSGSVDSMKSSIVRALAVYFDGIISQYTNSSFTEWRMIKYQMSDLSFAGDTDNTDRNEYIAIMERNLENYTTSDFYQYHSFIDGTYDWTIDID